MRMLMLLMLHLKLNLLLLVQKVEYWMDVFTETTLEIIQSRRHLHQLAFNYAAKYVTLLRTIMFFNYNFNYSLSVALGQNDVGACWKTSSSGLLLLTLATSFDLSLTPHAQSWWLTALNVTASRGCCSSDALRR